MSLNARKVALDILIALEKRRKTLDAVLDDFLDRYPESTKRDKSLLHTIVYGVLRYSPGYCGWHVSGQINLFNTLTPEKIGITLGESCLMNPLKSVSGVLVAGPPNIHISTPTVAIKLTGSCQ